MPRQARQLAGLGASDLPDQAAIDAYTGPPREVVVAADGLRVHDGVTRGGVRMARRSEVEAKASLGHTSAPDADYQVLATDVQVGFAVLTAARTAFLPDVDTFPLGQLLCLFDASGQCSPDRPITIQVGAGTGDTIAGALSVQIADPYAPITLRRGSANLWIIVR